MMNNGNFIPETVTLSQINGNFGPTKNGNFGPKTPTLGNKNGNFIP